MLLIILLYALLALTFTLGKAAVAYAHPLFLVGVRMILAGVILLAFYKIRALISAKPLSVRRLRAVPRQDWIDLLNVTFFHIYLSFVPEFWALQFVSSVKVNIMYATTPFITMLFSYLLYKEKVTVAQALGCLIAFCGLLPLMAREVSSSASCIESFSFALPEMVLLISISSAAYAWFIIKKLMNKGYSLLVINGFSMLVGGIASLLTWYAVKPIDIGPVLAVKPFLITVISLVLLSNVVVYNLYGWLLNYYSINVVACVGFLSPIFGALYGRIFLQEYLGWPHYVAILCITIGLYLFFYQQLHGKKRIPLFVPPPESA